MKKWGFAVESVTQVRREASQKVPERQTPEALPSARRVNQDSGFVCCFGPINENIFIVLEELQVNPQRWFSSAADGTHCTWHGLMGNNRRAPLRLRLGGDSQPALEVTTSVEQPSWLRRAINQPRPCEWSRSFSALKLPEDKSGNPITVSVFAEKGIPHCSRICLSRYTSWERCVFEVSFLNRLSKDETWDVVCST